MYLPLSRDGHMLTWLKSTFHFNVADYHLRMCHFSEAAAGFSEVIRLSPDHPTAYVNRGVALQGMNDHRRAQEAVAVGDHGSGGHVVPVARRRRSPRSGFHAPS
jgi:hypothetical protein